MKYCKREWVLPFKIQTPKSQSSCTEGQMLTQQSTATFETNTLDLFHILCWFAVERVVPVSLLCNNSLKYFQKFISFCH